MTYYVAELHLSVVVVNRIFVVPLETKLSTLYQKKLNESKELKNSCSLE